MASCLIPNGAAAAGDTQVGWAEIGHPLIRNYSPGEYGAYAQNWSIVQDRRGVMYFANTGGVLEYDGVSWRLITVPNEVVRSLGTDATGRIFVGGVGELGYLSADPAGTMRYRSLLDSLPLAYRDFSDVWSLWTTSDGVYFQTLSYVFFFERSSGAGGNGDLLHLKKTWKAQSAFTPSFQVEGAWFLPQQGLGLFRLETDSVQRVPGGEFFADKSIFAMLPYPGGGMLIATREGLFVYSDSDTRPLESEADDFLHRHRPALGGAVLGDGTYAMGTQAGGVIVFDSQGKRLGILNKASGLRSETVWSLYPDREGNLWMAMDDGMARVMTPSRVSIVDERSGLEGGVVSVCRDGDRLYLNTRTGVYFLSPSHGRATVERLVGIASQSWSLLRMGDVLLVGTTDGVYAVRGKKAKLIRSPWRFAYVLHRSLKDVALVYVGLHAGLAILRFDGRDWVDGGLVPGVTEIVQSIAEDTSGALWLGTLFQGVIRVSPPDPGEARPLRVDRFGPESGISSEQTVLFTHGRDVLFGTARGLKRFDFAAGGFEPDSVFGPRFADPRYRIKNIASDRDGNVWILGGRGENSEISLLSYVSEGRYVLHDVTAARSALTQRLEVTSYVMFPDDDGTLWIYNGERLMRFSSETPETGEDSSGFTALIRRVSVHDSVVFGGSLGGGGNGQPLPCVLAYSENAVRFEFAVPSFVDETSNRYQVFLDGHDRDWSAWTSETKRDYSNLSPGDYRFHVRSKDVFGRPGLEAVFTFTVLPPWYQTAWAYGLFAVLLGAMIWETARIRTRVLQRKTELLEAVVRDRTAQVLKQKDQLEEQARKLVELDHLKSRFFTNISHEFRTPLTLILGQIDSALSDPSEDRRASRLHMASRNARRLQRLINRLLDLARLESGKLKLQASPGNIVDFLKRRFYTFESLADQKHITMRFHSDHDRLVAYYDAEKLEEVIDNLLSNALKFTPEHGLIELRIGTPAPDTVQVTVRDSGAGIAADRLPHIFDRFYQAESGRSHEGSGIGLSLAKEMVELHRGSIGVESAEGQGTIFTIRLPLGRAHLDEDEIVPAEESPPALVLEDSSSGDALEAASEGPAEQARGPLPTLLVVEDNADMRSYICDPLRAEYEVAEAQDGEQGLARAVELVPDLIITDIMMPRMDGRELCRRIKDDNRTSHVPVIILTARASVESKIEGLETGADDYLVKPFHKDELMARVGNLIRQRRLLRRRFREVTAINPSEVSAKSIDQAFIERVLASIQKHIEDEHYHVNVLADEAGMSVSQLNRKLNALVDQSAGQLIRATRLEYAASLLRKNAGTVAGIAYRVGFSDHAAFTRSFKSRFGCSPSEFTTRHTKTGP